MREVCGLLAQSSADAALHELHAWAAELPRLHAVAESAKAAGQQLSASGVPPLSPRSLPEAVRQLTSDNQRLRGAVAAQAVAAHAAEEDIQSNTTASAAAVRHFMRLFDVKGAVGVLPKMNELYIAVSEAANVMRTLADILQLGARSCPPSLSLSLSLCHLSVRDLLLCRLCGVGDHRRGGRTHAERQRRRIVKFCTASSSAPRVLLSCSLCWVLRCTRLSGTTRDYAASLDLEPRRRFE